MRACNIVREMQGRSPQSARGKEMVPNRRGRRLIPPLCGYVLCVLGAQLSLGLFAATQSGEAMPAATEENAKKLSFTDTIQPILSENCYACHGPDQEIRRPEGGLAAGT